MGLSGRCEHGAPIRAIWIESSLLGGQEFDRDVNETVVQKPDHQAGFAGHGSMGGMPREQIAKYRVFGIGRAASHVVARVKVAHHEGNFPSLEPLFDSLLQKQTDVTQLD